MGQPKLLGLCYLPQNTVSAKARLGVWFVKGVDRRDAVIKYVNDGDHFQYADRSICVRLSKFDEPGVDSALQ